MDEDLKLYIPLGVKPEAELFTGFGKKQLFQALVGSLAMGGVAALVWLFTTNVTTTVVLALAGIFGSVMMTTKDQSNLSVVEDVYKRQVLPTITQRIKDMFDYAG